MKRNSVYYILGIALLCGVVGFSVYAGWRLLQAGDKPVAAIISPGTTVILDSGDGLAVVVKAESEAGLERMALMMDGQVYAEQSVSNEKTFTAVFPWYAGALGRHKLEVIAVDRLNRSSEAAVLLIGVRSRLEPDGMDYVYVPPVESTDGSGNNASQIIPVGDALLAQNGGGQPDQANGQQAPGQTLGDPILPEDLDILPNTQDGIPLITAFEAAPHRNGQQTQIVYHVEAQDDLGIDRLEFSVQNSVSGDSSSRTMLCFGEAVCTVDDNYPLGGTGIWLVGVHAIDTSGQSSGRHIVAVAIVDGGSLHPAIAILDAVAARPLVADQLIERGLGIPIDFRQVNPEVVIENSVTAENRCMQALVEPRANGNFVSAVYLCDEEAPEGTYLEWRVYNSPQYGGASELVLDRKFEDRTTIGPNDNFSFLHETPICGTWSNYGVYLTWVRTDSEGKVNVVKPPRSIYVGPVSGADCGSDAIIQDLQAVPGADGVGLTWKVFHLSEGSSPSYDVRRFDSFETAGVNLSRGVIDLIQVLVSGEVPFSFTDTTAVCGFHYYYYSVVTWDKAATVRVDRVPCHEGSIGNIQIQLNAGYALLERFHGALLALPTARQSITAHSVIPPGFPWPQSDNLVLRLNAENIDFSGGESGYFEPLPGNAMEIQITDEIKTNGYVFDSTALTDCRGPNYIYEYAWELLSNGQPIESGPVVKVNSSPCLPEAREAPSMTQIHGSSDPAVCGNQPYCAVIEWSPIPQLLSSHKSLALDELGLHRRASNWRSPDELEPPGQFWTVPLGQNSYIDANISCTTVAGSLQYSYQVIPMAQGLHVGHGNTTAFIDSPACGQPYNVVGTIE